MSGHLRTAKALRVFVDFMAVSIILAVGFSLASGQWWNLIFIAITIPAVSSHNNLTCWIAANKPKPYSHLGAVDA